MNQAERRLFLIKYLLAESHRYGGTTIPADAEGQKILLRSLMNVREAAPASDEFYRIQDEYLQESIRGRGITDIADIESIGRRFSAGAPDLFGDSLFLWRGDITTLRVDAIVNAANSGMTGCWQPCHSCIDNCIHTFAGVRLRSACDALMKRQGHPEPTGQAKITPAYNLPCKYVLHTVGPIVGYGLTERDCELLESCYRNCLDVAARNGVESIAFCCISTGVFRFPPERAAQIAVDTVLEWKRRTQNPMKVVFNVFSEKDEAIYARIFEKSNG